MTPAIFGKYLLANIPREDDGSLGTSFSNPFGNISPLSAGTLGLGVLGFGSILAKGPSPLPGQFLQAEQAVPQMYDEAKFLEGEGATLTAQGADALRMGQAGQLTDAQKAQLDQYRAGLTNKARQEFAAMGRNPDQDTAFINQSANIDAQVNAMAVQQISQTIQLGLGELQAGSSFSGQALGFANAANNVLIQAGEAQIKQDQAYSSSLTDAFKAIGNLFGTVGKTALMAA